MAGKRYSEEQKAKQKVENDFSSLLNKLAKLLEEFLEL